jgi:phospholipase C
MRRWLIIAGALFLLLGCGNSTAASTKNSRPVAIAASNVPITHVVLIVEENHSYSASYGSAMPYLTSLATKYGLETNEKAITHPSLPNYIALTSGSTGGFTGTDCSPSTSCQDTGSSIFSQTTSWRVLAESMPSNCYTRDANPYAVRHTAAPYYTKIATVCKTQDIPYSKSNTPNISSKFTFIAPNLISDAHDGTLAQADAWLKTVVPKILATSQYQSSNTLLEITFDEGSGTNQTVETVFVNPQVLAKKITLSATHYSLLRLNEELLGFPLLGGASSATDLRPALGL